MAVQLDSVTILKSSLEICRYGTAIVAMEESCSSFWEANATKGARDMWNKVVHVNIRTLTSNGTTSSLFQEIVNLRKTIWHLVWRTA